MNRCTQDPSPTGAGESMKEEARTAGTAGAGGRARGRLAAGAAAGRPRGVGAGSGWGWSAGEEERGRVGASAAGDWAARGGRGRAACSRPRSGTDPSRPGRPGEGSRAGTPVAGRGEESASGRAAGGPVRRGKRKYGAGETASQGRGGQWRAEPLPARSRSRSRPCRDGQVAGEGFNGTAPAHPTRRASPGQLIRQLVPMRRREASGEVPAGHGPYRRGAMAGKALSGTTTGPLTGGPASGHRP